MTRDEAIEAGRRVLYLAEMKRGAVHPADRTPRNHGAEVEQLMDDTPTRAHEPAQDRARGDWEAIANRLALALATSRGHRDDAPVRVEFRMPPRREGERA